MFDLVHMGFNFPSRKRGNQAAIAEEGMLCVFHRGTARFLEPFDLCFVIGCGL